MTKEQMILKIEELERRIRTLEEKVLTKPMDTIPTSDDVSRTDAKTMSCEMETAVINNLHKLGIPASFDGYRYLKTTIRLLTEGKITSDFCVTKELYPEVAKLHKKTPQQVERAIRHAIEVGYDRGDLEAWETIFGYSVSYQKGKPTNFEFIATFVEYIFVMKKSFT